MSHPVASPPRLFPVLAATAVYVAGISAVALATGSGWDLVANLRRFRHGGGDHPLANRTGISI